MAKDFTKYKVEGIGENLNKRELVLKIVEDYILKKQPNFDELQNVFPDKIQGTSQGFIRNVNDEFDQERFNIKKPLVLNITTTIVVSNQWGENCKDFIALATTLGYQINPQTNENKTINISTNNSIDKVIITISGRISNYFFGRIKEELFPEFEKVLEYGIGDIKTMEKLLVALHATTLDDSENDLSVFQSKFNMALIHENCESFSNIINEIEQGIDHYGLYELIFDEASNGVNVMEDDALISIQVNKETIISKQKLADFIGEMDYVDFDESPAILNHTQVFLDKNKEAFGIDVEAAEELELLANSSEVKQISSWFVPEDFTDFIECENKVVIEHDNIVDLDFYITTEIFNVNKILFLKYANMEEFHKSEPNYVGSYLFYDNKNIIPDQNIERDKGITLEFENNKRDLAYLMWG
jgi:hypothetical protein